MPWEMSVMATGESPVLAIDWNAMPSRPSGGETSRAKPDEYCEAATTAWPVAVRPARVTVSLKISPDTVEPSRNSIENVLCWSTAVLLSAVL